MLFRGHIQQLHHATSSAAQTNVNKSKPLTHAVIICSTWSNLFSSFGHPRYRAVTLRFIIGFQYRYCFIIYLRLSDDGFISVVIHRLSIGIQDEKSAPIQSHYIDPIKFILGNRALQFHGSSGRNWYASTFLGSVSHLGALQRPTFTTVHCLCQQPRPLEPSRRYPPWKTPAPAHRLAPRKKLHSS